MTEENLVQIMQHQIERLLAENEELRRINAVLKADSGESGKLPDVIVICCYCKNARSEQNCWQTIENYLHDLLGTDFSHGICPSCYESKMRPEIEAAKLSSAKRRMK